MLKSVSNELARRLPAGWVASIDSLVGVNAVLALRAPGGQRAKVSTQIRRAVTPRDVPNIVASVNNTPLFLVCPYLSPRARELLRGLGVSYADSTGNLRLALDHPAIFIETEGAEKDPTRQPRALRSLKGAAAARVARALCDFVPPYRLRTLAQSANIPLGTMSRVVTLLDEEALLSRDKKKQIIAADWVGIVRRWARDYDVKTSNRVVSYLDPRGLGGLTEKLSRFEGRYAATGSLAGPGIAPTRLAMIYVDDAEQAAKKLGLVPAEAGANVWLLEPYDDVVFERSGPASPRLSVLKEAELVCASPAQVAVDLMTSPGRGPQEAEELINKMKEFENDWRRKL